MKIAVLLVSCKNTPRRTELTSDWFRKVAGTVKRYFADQSGGRVICDFVVYDWLELSITGEEWWHAGTAPLLDVQPAHDVMTPPATRNRYRDELGAGRVTMTLIPGAGHALLPEQPEAVARAMLEYLKHLGHR